MTGKHILSKSLLQPNGILVSCLQAKIGQNTNSSQISPFFKPKNDPDPHQKQ